MLQLEHLYMLYHNLKNISEMGTYKRKVKRKKTSFRPRKKDLKHTIGQENKQVLLAQTFAELDTAIIVDGSSGSFHFMFIASLLPFLLFSSLGSVSIVFMGLKDILNLMIKDRDRHKV